MIGARRIVDGWRAARLAAAVIAVGAMACASRVPSTPESDRTRERATARADAEEAAAALQAVRTQFGAGNYAVVDSLAGQLVASYEDRRWVAPALLLAARASLELNRVDRARSRLAQYLKLYRASEPERAPGLILIAEILHLEGQPVAAGDSLLAIPTPLADARGPAARLARTVVAELGVQEIERLLARWNAEHPLASVFEVERASLLLASGDGEGGRAAARRALAIDPLEPEKRRAESILAGDLEQPQWRPIVGAILPLTGPLASYGQLAEEGIRLAVREYNRRHADSVMLIVRDDRDDPERAGQLVRELEEMGAVAIVGPLRSEGLRRASERRRDRDLLLVSPTAPENLNYERNVYSLWLTTERAARGARALAAYAVRELQLYRFGVLYPAGPEGRAQLAAFADEARAWGAEVSASIPYDQEATTFEEPLTFLRQVRPQAIFAPAGKPENVIQLAPQFAYYGLRGVQILGDAEWSAPQVLRLVEARFVNGSVISTFLHRASPSVRWPEFVEMYERAYRKGLQDNLVPALAYDASELILRALPWGYPRRSAVARSFRETRNLPGATGILSVRDGTITRRPFILHIQDRELRPAVRDLGTEARAGNGGARQ